MAQSLKCEFKNIFFRLPPAGGKYYRLLAILIIYYLKSTFKQAGILCQRQK